MGMGETDPARKALSMTLAFKCTGGGGGVPPGAYTTELKSFETKEATYDGRTTQRLISRFEVKAGKHQGEAVFAFCGTFLSPKTKLFKFASAMLGRQLQPGEVVNLESFIGKDFLVIVEKSPKSESTQVVSILPATATN